MKNPKLFLTTFQVGTQRKRGEGIRIGTVRYVPHGIRKDEYAERDCFDVWLPVLAPSRELLDWVRASKRDDAMQKFAEKYRREMEKITDARQTIILLAQLAASTRLAIGCYCADESVCHRRILSELIHEAARECS